MEYPIYIRISATKYIKIAHQGGKIPADKIEMLKSKGLHFLYIRQEDFAKLVGFTLTISKAVLNSGQVTNEKKARFLEYTAEVVLQQVYVTGLIEASFENAKEFMASSMNLLSEDEETFSLMEMLSNHTDYLYAHSLGVSMFSVIIGKQLGWQPPQNQFKLGFADLFHDIGKKESQKKF